MKIITSILVVCVLLLFIMIAVSIGLDRWDNAFLYMILSFVLLYLVSSLEDGREP